MDKLNIFDSIVCDYLSELSSIGLSGNTIKNYQKRLRLFKNFWIQNDSGCEPTADDIRAWRDSMLCRGVSPSTVKQYLVELKSFFEFASDEDRKEPFRYSENPVSSKMFPKVKQEQYDKVLTPDDLKKLWINQKGTADKLWARNYAIVTLLLDGKIRNAELLDLRLSDIHFADSSDPYDYLFVRNGKGGKQREVDLSPISVSALKLYLKSDVRPKDVDDDDYLFGTTAEKKFGGTSRGYSKWHMMSGSGLSKLVENHVKKVTGKSGFRTHSMRHNGAIIDLNNGVSTEMLQAELGHSSIQTTQIYSGRLLSKRNRRNMQEVIAVRDEWAEKNKAMLEGA